jgi:hypothetical protein
MLLSADTLFVAGWPDAVDPADPYAGPQGLSGGVLWSFNAATGEKLGKLDLDSPPRFDAMAAADGRLYLSTRNGTVLCMRAQASR